MIRLPALCWISCAMVLGAAESSDLLRFANGDQLHGRFQGIKEGPRAIWQRDDLNGPVDFKLDQVRHVVLRGGRPAKSLETLSHVALVNGDRLPGTITHLDESALGLETPYAGPLRIPREQVAMFAPSPLGGRIHYHGPFVADEWTMAHASFPEGMPDPPEEDDEKAAEDAPGRWTFSGSAWYWPSKHSGTALLRENSMPDRAILRFDLAWKNRLSIAIGFHADCAKPKQPDEEKDGEALRNARRRLQGFVPGDSTILPVIFGNSYVLQVFSTHMMLFRTLVDKDGEPTVERVQINGSSIRLGDTGSATMEIRSNRTTGEIALFINDEFVVQWSEGAGGERAAGDFAGKGGSFGFVVQNEDSPVKISDVMVAEWNGMPDSARSLQVEEQDIVLLANGTDRFSGKVRSFEDGKISLEGKYGRFQFDLADVAEIRFARNGLAKETEPAADNLVVRFSPLGRISGRPVSGNSGIIRMLNPVCGEIDLKLDSAVMLDFQPSNSIIDDWDPDF